MSEQPLVSVVIATYNMSQYLTKAIDSVLAQTWTNLELIVVDDGSTDGTPGKMESFEDDPRVRYLPTENQGQPRAKNRGVRETKGDFIAFCDADDLWSPNKLAIQMPFFKDLKVGVVYSDVSYIDQNGAPLEKEIPYERHSGDVTQNLVVKNFVPFGTAVVRRACVERNGVFDVNLPMGIDWDLWLRYSIDWHFRYAPDVTYIYRIWPGQMSKNYRGRYDNAFRILNKFIEAHPDAIPEKLKARAWSDMYVSRGINLARGDKTFFEPMKDVLTGLRCDITYKLAWKSLAKLLLRRL
jgi:glycosyltransferase involved in cell wall biosynthesis